MKPTLVRAGNAIIEGQDEPLRQPAILVENGRITSIQSGVGKAAHADADVVDLEDLTLLPGLIDAHVHLVGHRGYTQGGSEDEPIALLRAVEDCRKLLHAGFTSVRDVGSRYALTLSRAQQSGLIAGPRIYAAGPIICQTGGHADFHSMSLEQAKDSFLGRLADGVEGCRFAVRRNIREGADLIKICTSGGIGSERDDPHHQHYTDDEVQVIVQEAHRVGKRVASHAQGKKGVLLATRHGVDTIEHAYHLDEECAASIAQTGAVLVPTVGLVEIFKRAREEGAGMPPWRLRKQAEAISAMEGVLPIAVEHGLCIAAGSDYFGAPGREHGDNANEPIAMVKYGLSTAQALKAVTECAAEAIGVRSELGSLAPGRIADLVAVHGSPLDDISALKRVQFVMQNGRVVIDKRRAVCDWNGGEGVECPKPAPAPSVTHA